MTYETAIDRSGRSALHYAALEDDVATVQRLITDGADVALADEAGATPLHFAAQGNAARAATILLAAGAPVDARDAHGNSPLATATYNADERAEVVRLLLANGADPDLENNAARSARYLAALTGRAALFDAAEAPRAAPPRSRGDAADTGTVSVASIWANEVPPRGQASTVRGELLRAIAKLRDEAQRNGNVNWSEQHARLARFLERHLLEGAQPEVVEDLARLGRASSPVSDDDVYERLTAAVLDWAASEQAPSVHQMDPDLRI